MLNAVIANQVAQIENQERIDRANYERILAQGETTHPIADFFVLIATGLVANFGRSLSVSAAPRTNFGSLKAATVTGTYNIVR